MRASITFVAMLVLVGSLRAQVEDVPPRFDVLHSPDLYKQDTPQNALNSAVIAITRDRHDYFVAHLLDPAFVDARLATNQAYFERAAAEQLAATVAGRILTGVDLQNRVRQVGTRLNVKQLADQVREKMADEPDHLKDLKRFAREGRFEAAGDTAKATLPDMKDRALYFKKTGGRWFLENRKEDRPVKE
jgi:hypothetical protein